MKLSKEIFDLCIEVLNRYGWSRWDGKQTALVESRISRGKYQCAECLNLFGPKDVQVDHVQPRIDPGKGRTTLDDWAARTFVSGKKLQVLCKPCHKLKTAQENKVRRTGG